MNKHSMILEWDERKRESNLVNHGADFSDAAEVFADPYISIKQDAHRDYGEERFNAYGMAAGHRMRVCFTMRGENVIRIISMFKVHKKEWEKNYGNY